MHSNIPEINDKVFDKLVDKLIENSKKLPNEYQTELINVLTNSEKKKDFINILAKQIIIRKSSEEFNGLFESPSEEKKTLLSICKQHLKNNTSIFPSTDSILSSLPKPIDEDIGYMVYQAIIKHKGININEESEHTIKNGVKNECIRIIKEIEKENKNQDSETYYEKLYNQLCDVEKNKIPSGKENIISTGFFRSINNLNNISEKNRNNEQESVQNLVTAKFLSP